VAGKLPDEGAVQVVRLEAGDNFAGLCFQLVPRVRKVLLSERLDHVHVKTVRIFLDLLPVWAGLLQQMDLLLQPQVLHIQALELLLDLVEK
jgi:hypothetical protein